MSHTERLDAQLTAFRQTGPTVPPIARLSEMCLHDFYENESGIDFHFTFGVPVVPDV